MKLSLTLSILLLLFTTNACSPPNETPPPSETPPPLQTFNPLEPPSESNNLELYDLALLCLGSDKENFKTNNEKALFFSKDRKSIQVYTRYPESSTDTFGRDDIEVLRPVNPEKYYMWKEDTLMGGTYYLNRVTLEIEVTSGGKRHPEPSNYRHYYQCSISPMNELINLINSWHDDNAEKQEAKRQEEIRKKNEEKEKLERIRKI